ncbi:phenylalanine--tRNA ligase subunit beta [uncultured Faecalibaculum sp.]|uniref:phenylalanine--tRNA ligase subunit beta n=1 Tax=uncultured Faecalibaculum sp. TaxID=1729681 RepID=UPI0025EBC917|nr:phenylalanine--tRNA ligase subunit beta [uncultured Faecalibaculum sp.]
MRISRKWLSQYMDLSDLSLEELAEKITAAGFEVEGTEILGQGTGLVIGQVLTCEPHPDSDHLHVTTVDTGDEVLNIVCGAPNVAAGQKVIVARPGARLPGGEIKAGKIRGVESCGMICALFELGVDRHLLCQEQIDGIEILPQDAPVGHEDPLEYLGYRDEILEIGLTPNRSDCLAAFNMAAEAGAILNRPVTLPAFEGAADEGKPTDAICRTETEGCSLFMEKVIGSVTIKPSPKWMQELLRASGMHSINNVVDISNIVMLETGQPMHFYDIDAIAGHEITVKDGFRESYTALDGVAYQLEPQDLVITNQGRPIGIAGIMGGEDSKILDTTRGLIIECALFDHVRIRNTARRLNLNTEASQRYQKGIEPLAAQKAMDRAVQLLKEYADATDIEATVIAGSDGYKPREITCTLEEINHRLGTDFKLEEVVDVLERLHFSPVTENGIIRVTIPSCRTDMEGMADVSEEVIRLLGYDRLPSTLPEMPMTEGKLDPMQRMTRMTRTMFSELGFQEALTYTLVSTEKKEEAVLTSGDAIELASPLSEQRRWIRTGILPSLLEAAAYNRSRKVKDIALFEISDIETATSRTRQLAFVIEGNLQNSEWTHVALPADFYTAKGILEAWLKRQGIDEARIRFKADAISDLFHPYRSARILVGRDIIGVAGEIHPSRGKERTVMAEVDMTRVLKLKKSKVRFKPVSKYPAVDRDIALVLKQDVPAAAVKETVLRQGRLDKETVIRDVQIFDVYQGEHVAEDEKSLALRLVFQSDKKTLTDDEIGSVMDKVLSALEKEHSAKLRS